ncbi:hypothetical protein [Methanosarcina sp.]|uniref:hypothetical protein n=1 Tax=Methanosarcina sp. TaxID=2213 RepID=UPI002ABA882F|nr:hypothetical protein [Methanosarcina sp.]MDY9925510.1 hypothetical protein [Methanosarcina sp.]
MRGMIHFFSILFCISLVFAAGCTENGQVEPLTDNETPEIAESPEVAESPSGTEAEEISIEITEAPERVRGGDAFNIRWKVSGGSPGNISDTRILSSSTHAGPNIDAYPSRSLSQNGISPQEFEGSIVAPAAGNLYFRVYAVVDGTEIISREEVIEIRTSYQY